MAISAGRPIRNAGAGDVADRPCAIPPSAARVDVIATATHIAMQQSLADASWRCDFAGLALETAAQ